MQIGTLCRLRHLHLRHPYHDVDSYASLARLPLHTLELVGVVRALPSCLSRLTSMEALVIDGSEMEDEQGEVGPGVLASALPQLTQLTRLDLAVSSAAPLAALTALHRLRWLCWGWEPDGGAAALPPGGWMQQLQTLAAPQPLVARSLPALSSASSLEQLCPYPHRGSTDAQLRTVISWAVQHSSLQQLLLGDRLLSGCVWGEVTAATRLRPSLCIVPSMIAESSCIDCSFI